MTQLYVSVDASTKDSLKKIDRPLFRDFWPRFLDSLKALSEKVWILHDYVLVKGVCISTLLGAPSFLASHADGLRARHGGTRDKPKNVCVGGYKLSDWMEGLFVVTSLLPTCCRG